MALYFQLTGDGDSVFVYRSFFKDPRSKTTKYPPENSKVISRKKFISLLPETLQEEMTKRMDRAKEIKDMHLLRFGVERNGDQILYYCGTRSLPNKTDAINLIKDWYGEKFYDTIKDCLENSDSENKYFAFNPFLKEIKKEEYENLMGEYEKLTAVGCLRKGKEDNNIPQKR